MAKIPMSRGLFDALVKPYRSEVDPQFMPEGRGVSLLMLREFVEWGQANYHQNPECVRWLTDKLAKLNLTENSKVTPHGFFNAFNLKQREISKTEKLHSKIRGEFHMGASRKDLIIKYRCDRKTIYRAINRR